LLCCGEARISIADGVNFFLAGMQSGFGPFVAVLLANEKWTQQNIGLVLSASSLAGLLSQPLGGELLDASRSKRFLVALGGIPACLTFQREHIWPHGQSLENHRT
jgi:MFS family permease